MKKKKTAVISRKLNRAIQKLSLQDEENLPRHPRKQWFSAWLPMNITWEFFFFFFFVNLFLATPHSLWELGSSVGVMAVTVATRKFPIWELYSHLHAQESPGP